MKKIMFNDRYGLTKAVFQGRKTMTRRVLNLTEDDEKYLDQAFDWDLREYVILDRYAQYKVGEVVAVAQKYIDLRNCDAFYEALEKADPTFPLECIKYEKGCYNKMFVKAQWMPRRIRISGIKVERLQDISKQDCLREGIEEDSAEGSLLYWWEVPHEGISWEEYKKRCYELSRHDYKGKPGSYFWETPQDAFARLIDKVNKKGTWDRNPWVIAYTFKLVEGAEA